MDAAAALDALLGPVGVAVGPGDRVLDLGCGDGARTAVLLARGADVVAVDVAVETLRAARERLGPRADDVTWVLADGETLEDVGDATVDAAVAPELLGRLPSAKARLAHLAELGRVLRPGGWVVVALSTDPGATAPASQGSSRRELLRSLARRGAPPPAAFVPLEALGATAVQAGLTLERIEGAGSRDTVVLARRQDG